ncbi:MAG: anthranilate synthase component I [Phycisphaerae bacterium]|nr:anthranilate synthase component I [Phycisphaerae bacterium]MDW8261842.1 anthranilate synthase component I [Phycisphaerales bacterium]
MIKHFPDFASFESLSRDFNCIPVYRQLLADRLTPVAAFEILSNAEHAFLFESVVGGERIARYSFLGANPSLVYSCHNGRAAVSRAYLPPEHFDSADPLGDLRRILPATRTLRDPRLPTFTGGLVGYAGYDTIRYYEAAALRQPPVDDRGLPDLLFGLYDELIVFDHVDKTVKAIANARISQESATKPGQAYADACRRVDALVARLQQPVASNIGEIDPHGPVSLPYVSNLTQQQFEAAVRRGLEYIRAGDIFQFVPSQRLRVSVPARPFDVYRALRIINPSPFMFYVKTPFCVLIGSSPEILCRVQPDREGIGKVVTSRPLAGTRRRGTSPEEDKRLEQDLLADPKDRAEHIMLVDLHRNDVGRVCKPGTVRVTDCMTIERYSHVMHISSNVEGELRDDCTAFDALRVSLPVGTVSGAPKIRAMQIIDEVEPTRRGPYGGAVGYFDFSGNSDTCIALRTIVHHSTDLFDVQVGAGVVADSVPSAEYEETLGKARAMLKAVELAQRGL